MAILQNSLLNDKGVVASKHCGENIIDLGKKTFKIPTTFSYRWATADEDFAARPDLVSQAMYDTDIYGDVIAKLNGYGNPFEFPDDDVVMIPEMLDIASFFYYSKDETESEDVESKPIAKKKNEPRKACDAVVGDTRFKIDSSRKIVVY